MQGLQVQNRLHGCLIRAEGHRYFTHAQNYTPPPEGMSTWYRGWV
jgi:hypothetical protein